MRTPMNAVNCFGYVFILTLVGCSSSDWKAKTFQVTGTVSINGESPVGLVVSLVSVGSPVDSRASRPWGIVQEDGHYKLTTYDSQSDGAPAGRYAVTLFWPKNIHGDPTDRLYGIHRSSKKPVAEFVIDEKTTTLPPIVLTKVKVMPVMPNEDQRLTPGQS